MVRSFILVVLVSLAAFAQKQPKIDPSTDVPVISADLGQCTADFRVVDVSQKPIYSARIATEIKWGFAGVHRTTLEVFTNSDGKARFTRLPNHSKKPINFDISFGGRQTGVFMDPDQKCVADFQVVLPDKKTEAKPAEQKPEDQK